jgi:hypothetical protein
MMTANELTTHLTHLKLDPAEASQLLGVSTRTLRRWLDGEEVPGPAEAALRAWHSLNARNLPWKPDSTSIFDDDRDQIERQNRHAKEMAALIDRVEARRGPANPWSVDLPKNAATFGPFEVGFYNLRNGGFSLSTYRRKDAAPNPAHDMPYLEDAAYCISQAFSKARAGSAALRAVAEYTRKHSSLFVVDGPSLLSPAQRKRRTQDIEAQADKIDELAAAAAEGKATYLQFEEILSKLHSAGFYPEVELISATAKAMV